MGTNNLMKEVILNNKVKKYIDTNIRSLVKNNKELMVDGYKYLINILMDANNPILKGIAPTNARGICSELMLRYILEYYFSANDINYSLFDNVMLDNKHTDMTTQIDTIVITNNCIIVIECKSLYGNFKIANGIMDINMNGQIVRQIKPWNQNMGHILTLREELGKLDYRFNDTYYENVVFLFGIGYIDSCTLRNREHLWLTSTTLKSLDRILNTQRYYYIDNSELVKATKYLLNKTHSIYQEALHVKNIQDKFAK